MFVCSWSPDAHVRREPGVFGMSGAQSPACDPVKMRCGMVWVGNDLKDHPIPPLCRAHGQGHVQAAQSSIPPVLGHFQVWEALTLFINLIFISI